MGGKNPTIVLPDANLDEAVSLVAKSAFGLTGQACTATSRVIVHEEVKQRFVEKAESRSQSDKNRRWTATCYDDGSGGF